MSTSTAARPRKQFGAGISRTALGRLFLAPSALLMIGVTLIPILYAFTLSLIKYDGRQSEGFGGVVNYARAFTDPDFWASLGATAIFTVVSVALEFVIGLAFALIMNTPVKGQGIVRAVILVPWVIPTVVAAQMWSILFNVQPGFLNHWLHLGDFNWLGQIGWSMASIITADVWKTAPFVALLLLAGLQTIPRELYESARVDGASTLQQFWSITLPALRPSILVALLFRTVDALRVYDLPAVMTFGQFDTQTLSMLVHRYVVQTVDLGYGSALSTLTFLVILIVSVVFIRLLGRDAVVAEA